MEFLLSEEEMRVALYAVHINELAELDEIRALRVIEREMKETDSLNRLVARYQRGHRVLQKFYFLPSQRLLPFDPNSDAYQILVSNPPSDCVGYVTQIMGRSEGKQAGIVYFFFQRLESALDDHQIIVHHLLSTMSEDGGVFSLPLESGDVSVIRISNDAYFLFVYIQAAACPHISFFGNIFVIWEMMLNLEVELDREFRLFYSIEENPDL